MEHERFGYRLVPTHVSAAYTMLLVEYTGAAKQKLSGGAFTTTLCLFDSMADNRGGDDHERQPAWRLE